MRDKKRIKRLLLIIGELWKQNPNLRFGQIILNCLEQEDLYHLEDDELENRLKVFYNVY